MRREDNYWTRKLARRRMLAGAGTAALGVGAMALTGCGDDDDGGDGGGGSPTQAGGSPAATAAPKTGGVLRQADITQAAHFSPYHPSADPSFVNFWRRDTGYYDRLWDIMDTPDPQKQVALRLAEKVEQPDPTTYVITLREGVKFHNRAPANGRAMTAEDVVQVYEFLKKPPASGGAFVQSGKDMKSITAVDAKTIRLETFGPRAFTYEELAPRGLIVPKEMLDEQTQKNTPPIGTGPYMYKAHQQGSTEELVKNPDYWRKGQPYPDGKKVTFIPDAAAGEAAFRDGQIDDISFTDVKQRDSVKQALGNKITLQDYPSTSGLALVLNIHRPPFNDPRVREAIHRAIDAQRIINIVWFGDGDPAWYFSDARTSRFPIGRKAVEQYVGFDQKKAADLLKAAGVDPNKEYELMAPVETQTWVDASKLISEDLAKVGLKTKVTPIVRNVYLQKAGPKPGDFDITMSVFLDYIYMQTNSGTFWDNTSLEDKEVDALADKIKETINAEERKKLSNDIEIMLAKKYSNFVPVLSAKGHTAWYSYVKGVNLESSRVGSRQGNQIGLWLDKA